MTFKCYVTLNGVKGLPLQNNVTLISTAKYYRIHLTREVIQTK
jgi:hypothetical protein